MHRTWWYLIHYKYYLKSYVFKIYYKRLRGVFSLIMCGIFVYCGKQYTLKELLECINVISHRGPDDTVIKYAAKNVLFGFHRLAIMDPSKGGSQPMNDGEITYMCNGEIYNWKELAEKYDFNLKSHCDCEIISHMYRKFGFHEMIKQLDGYFAITLFDEFKDTMYVARDPFGVRPLYIGTTTEVGSIISAVTKVDDLFDCLFFSSEMKAISSIEQTKGAAFHIEQFPPATVAEFTREGSITLSRYFEYTPYNEDTKHLFHTDVEEIKTNICKLFVAAVVKRINADRPIGALLSGGIDSSLAASLACKFLRSKYEGNEEYKVWDRVTPSLEIPIRNKPDNFPLDDGAYYAGEISKNKKQIEKKKKEEIKEDFKFRTFSIGLTGSPDIKFAREVCVHIGSDHYQSIVSDNEFLEAIERTIYNVESYDVTTIRASVGNYLVCNRIGGNNDTRVLFNGDGSDEVFCGYKYFSKCTSPEELNKENIKLMSNIHFFDVQRSDRSISTNGIEARTPFLDIEFVKYCMMIHPSLKMSHDKPEKYLLRQAFIDSNILPLSIINRTKEAFSDGVSNQKRSWHNTINTFVSKFITDEKFAEGKTKFIHNSPETKEAFYYRCIFEKYYPSHGNVIPYFWMPNSDWCKVSDPSAREIK